MTETDKFYPYDVALSYASEDRVYAEVLASILRRGGVKVFYDKYEKATLWGKNLYTYLSDLYQNKARYCVIFLSQNYATKRWTRHELESAQARAFMSEHEDYILPIRLDQTEIPGILPSLAYLTWVEGKAESIADSIMQKLGKGSLPSIDPIKEQFWKLFTSQVLRISLILICEDIPDAIAALILPLQREQTFTSELPPNDLTKVGKSLVGWLGQSRSFHMFLDPAPSFEYPTDFHLYRLLASEEDTTKDSTLIAVQRHARPLNLSKNVVATIRRLLEPLYEEAQYWLNYSSQEAYNTPYSTTDFFGPNPLNLDDMLNETADLIIRLGGQTIKGYPLWRFCCILQPKDIYLPHSQHNLFVRARSKQSPYQQGTTRRNSRDFGISTRAYQSGHIIYRPNALGVELMMAHSEQEETTRSAIAIPIGGEDGIPVAIIYIASDEVDAFSESDQRVLRVIGNIVGELFMTFRAREQITQNLKGLLTSPSTVDTAFRYFLSENEFIYNVEALLTEIHLQNLAEQESMEVLSFIAIDIDKLTPLAIKYGDRAARNLSREVGMRLQGQLHLQSNPEFRKVYHIGSDRYYVKLPGMTLDDARNLAVRLRQLLRGNYRVDVRRPMAGRPILPDELLMLDNVTVRIGVLSYQHLKLKEVLQRYPTETAVAEVRMILMLGLDVSLEFGQNVGGDCIISWDPVIWGFRHWSPSE